MSVKYLKLSLSSFNQWQLQKIKMENSMFVGFLLFTVMFVGFLTAMPTENVLPAEQNFDEGRRNTFLLKMHATPCSWKKGTQKLEYTSFFLKCRLQGSSNDSHNLLKDSLKSGNWNFWAGGKNRSLNLFKLDSYRL